MWHTKQNTTLFVLILNYTPYLIENDNIVGWCSALLDFSFPVCKFLVSKCAYSPMHSCQLGLERLETLPECQTSSASHTNHSFVPENLAIVLNLSNNVALLAYLTPKLWVLHRVWGWKYIALLLCIPVPHATSLCGISHVHGKCHEYGPVSTSVPINVGCASFYKKYLLRCVLHTDCERLAAILCASVHLLMSSVDRHIHCVWCG